MDGRRAKKLIGGAMISIRGVYEIDLGAYEIDTGEGAMKLMEIRGLGF